MIIVAIGVVGFVVSNLQKEAGIAEPGKGGVAAVAAALSATDASLATDEDGYRRFSQALLVASVATRNLPIVNPADTRLEVLLVKTIDCLSALREAWQADIDGIWDLGTHGTAAYWRVLHPAVEMPAGRSLLPADIRAECYERAVDVLDKAADLVS